MRTGPVDGVQPCAARAPVRALARPSRAVRVRRRLGRGGAGALRGRGALGGVGGQRPKRARKLAEQLAREGDAETPELRALLDGRLALAVNYLSAVLVLAIVVLMVFKPGAG